MSEERTTLSDDEIQTTPGDTLYRRQDDSDTGDDTDTDTDTTDADTDDTDSDSDGTDA